MIFRTAAVSALLLLSGCTGIGLNSGSIAAVTEEYGQCIANTREAPIFGHKKVTFICQDGRVLLGGAYEEKGQMYIDSGVLTKREDRYSIKDRSRAVFVEGLHSVCQLKPAAGNGTKQIRRFYFDMRLKECRSFVWSGKGGIVPFRSMDECEQHCHK